LTIILKNLGKFKDILKFRKIKNNDLKKIEFYDFRESLEFSHY